LLHEFLQSAITSHLKNRKKARRILMKVIKKLIALAALTAMISVSMSQLDAQEYRTEAGGYGYEQSRRVPSLAPAIALGTIALVAIIAVAVQNSGHHDHGHSHSHN
jgi:predicted ATPase